MSTEKTFSGRNRDIQDGTRRHVWKKLEHTDTGALITVAGAGTEDQKAIVLNTGQSFNLEDDTNAEVFLLAGASDLAQKYAILSIPRDKQRKWPKSSGGIQNPTTPDKFVQLDGERIWLKDGNFALGDNQELKISISGGKVTFSTDNDVDIRSPKLTHNGVNIGDTHVHSQGDDSHGDGEVDTDPPH